MNQIKQIDIMQLLFESELSHAAGQKRIKAEVLAAQSICEPFEICCSEERGVWGIWMMIDGKRFLVDPIELTNSLFVNGMSFSLLTALNAPNNHYGNVTIRKEAYYFTWMLSLGISNDYLPRHYRLDDYANRIRSCINELLDAWNEGSVMAYDESDLTKADIEMAVKQLSVEGVMPGYYYRMSASLEKEDFVFCFDPDDKYYEAYTIGIGDRQYSTVFTHWDNDFEVIRHQLESIAYNKEVEMTLSFDCSELIVRVKDVDVLSSVNTIKSGYSFQYEKFALVEIFPNAFLTGSILKGYCDLKQTIQTFYEELLLLAMGHAQQEMGDFLPARMETYNMFKSPIIERWIVGENKYTNRAQVRQVWVKDVIIISPDYDGVVMTLGNEYTDIGEYYNKEGHPIVMPELDGWLQSVRQAIVNAAVGEYSDFDWKVFHDRGLELAQQLRDRLSSDFDLWYESPFEDNSGAIPRRRLIYNRLDTSSSR